MDSFPLQSPRRRGLGLTLLLVGLVCIGVGMRLDWGVAVTLIVPGLVLLVPGWGMQRGGSLTHREGALVLQRGGGEELLPLTQLTLEAVPTAGAVAVVAHLPDGSEQALATWLSPGRAERLLAQIDSWHGAPLPRRQRQAANWDR